MTPGYCTLIFLGKSIEKLNTNRARTHLDKMVDAKQA